MHVYRVMPHKVKLGALSFRCSCRDSHRTLVCDDTIAVNMLFDPELKVPDEERAGQIKAREKAKLANPFTAGTEKERKRREKAKKDELEKPVWNPSIERADGEVPDSVAQIVAKPTRRKLQVSLKSYILNQSQ